MGVSYEKLRMMMAKHKIKGWMLREKTGISATEAAKINKDVYMTMQSTEKILKYLSQVSNKPMRVEDILTFIDD
jgi:DNA-binding Xre family transcriptional regulator